MRWIASLLLFLSSGLPLNAEVLAINQFSGLNTDDSPLQLAEGQTPDSENVVTDDGPGGNAPAGGGGEPEFGPE